MSSDLLYKEIGYKPESNTSRLSMVRSDDKDIDFEIQEIRTDGSVRSWPYLGFEDIKMADVQRAINNYNQTVMRTEEISEAIKTASQPVAPTITVQEQSAPAQAGKQRQSLTGLINPSSSTSNSVQQDPQAAKDTLRQKLRDRLKANGQ